MFKIPAGYRGRWLFLFIVGIILVGCGSIATSPRPTFEPTSTFDVSIVITRTATPVQVAVDTDSQDADEPDEVAVDTPTPAVAAPDTPTPTPEPDTPTPTATVAEVASDLPGDPVLGEQYFREFSAAVSSTEQGCIACHNPDEPVPGPGPYIYGIADVASERIPGYSAYDYLYESIADPMAFIAPSQPGFDTWPTGDMANAMPLDWETTLGPDVINDIVAYLLTLSVEE